MSGPSRYVSVSDHDGMVSEARTKEQFAQVLTESGYLPLEQLCVLTPDVRAPRALNFLR
jgi:hypothetical protein